MSPKLNTIRLDQNEIKNQFQNENHQGVVILKLYRMVNPEFDKIQKFLDWPTCNEFTWKYICQLFIDFDKKYHPECLSGGGWMNSGFSIDKNLDNFEFNPAENVRYFGDKNPIQSVYINYSWVNSIGNKEVRISIRRKFTHANYTVKHFANFAKMLYSMGFKINSVKPFCEFTR